MLRSGGIESIRTSSGRTALLTNGEERYINDSCKWGSGGYRFFFYRYILKEFEHSPPLADYKRIIYLKYKN
jgi:hypothetical protein